MDQIREIANECDIECVMKIASMEAKQNEKNLKVWAQSSQVLNNAKQLLSVNTIEKGHEHAKQHFLLLPNRF